MVCKPIGIGKVLTTKWGAKCSRCGGYIGKGTKAVWTRSGSRSHISHLPVDQCGPDNLIHDEAAVQKDREDASYAAQADARRAAKLHPRIARRQDMRLR